MPDITFDVKKHLGVIADTGNGWKKEANIISWNGRAAKLDIREWNSDKTKMKKGVTFSKTEIGELKKLILEIDVDEPDIFDAAVS